MRFFDTWKNCMHELRLESQLHKTTKELEEVRKVAEELNKALTEEMEATVRAKETGEAAAVEVEQVHANNELMQREIETHEERMQALQRRLEECEQQIQMSRNAHLEALKETDAYEKKRQGAEKQKMFEAGLNRRIAERSPEQNNIKAYGSGMHSHTLLQ